MRPEETTEVISPPPRPPPSKCKRTCLRGKPNRSSDMSQEDENLESCSFKGDLWGGPGILAQASELRRRAVWAVWGPSHPRLRPHSFVSRLLDVSALGLPLYLGSGVDAYSENRTIVACAELIRKPKR